MIATSDILIRDQLILVRPAEGLYYLFGTTDPDLRLEPGGGFDRYTSHELSSWEGPIPAFRPPRGRVPTHFRRATRRMGLPTHRVTYCVARATPVLLVAGGVL
jgi:hypothetical protein